MQELNKKGYPNILNYILWDGKQPLNSIDFITAPNPPLKEDKDGQYNDAGVKIKTDLLGSKYGELCVRRIFTENPEERTVKIQFQWFNSDGSIFETKETVVEFSYAQWEKRLITQRERIFNDLKGRAKKFNVESYIDAIYNEFYTEKLDFETTGSLMFSQSIAGFILIDTDSLEDGARKRSIIELQTILNNSLDGVNKVYETLIYLTSNNN